MPKTPRKRTHRTPHHPSTGTTPKSTAGRETPKRAAPRTKRKKAKLTISQVVAAALDDLKATDVSVLDVRHLTTVTDMMIVASGRSERHVRAIADEVVVKCKQQGYRPIGVEGQKVGDWVLVDLGDVVVHVMQPRAREFYNLEKLWDIAPGTAAEAAGMEIGDAAGHA
jgi:ribosome-associated protein